MFQRIFKRAQKKKPQPTILINSLDNDKTRGDMHGYAGIVAHLAQKMNAKIVTTDNATLMAEYPEAATPEKALRCYLDAHGAPEIYFGKCDKTTRAYLYENGTRHIEDTLNETFSRIYLENTDLVPHHITQESLKQAAENLEADYPDLKQPLITVFIANVVEQTADMLSKKLAGICREYPQASIFVCSSWRTDDDAYDRLMAGLEKNIKNAGLKEHTNITGFNLNRNRAAGGDENPYQGLLQKSDHAIVWGISRSMVSEVLATGKTVYILQDEDSFKNALAQGQAKRVDAHPENTALATEDIPPVDVTKKIADDVYNRYKASPKRTSFINRMGRSF